MGSSSSSSSTSSARPTNPDCYLRNKMMRQQCLQTRLDNEYIIPKPHFDKNPTEGIRSVTQHPVVSNGKTQLGCDCQGNVVECDENGRIIRVVKPNHR